MVEKAAIVVSTSKPNSVDHGSFVQLQPTHDSSESLSGSSSGHSNANILNVL